MVNNTNKKPHVKHVLANNVIGLFGSRRQSIVEKPLNNNLLEIANKKKVPHGKKGYNDFATNLANANA